MTLASILALFLAGILGPGYLLWLFLLSKRRRPFREDPGALPRIDVIVPVHDERAWIASKIDNLRALAYPPDRVRFLVADGASTDATLEIARSRVTGDDRFDVFSTPRADKIAQLNSALARASAPWILVTDCDARLPGETLLRLVAATEEAPDLAVVGAVCEPDRPQALDRTHWDLHNRLRLAESERGFASLVTGPCYMFRRDLLTRFPEDAIGDDVHVTLSAAAASAGSALVPIRVVELRSPIGFEELVRHKFRKADAYAREILRFAGRSRAMEPRARAIFWWRAGQIFLLPALIAFGTVGLAASEPVALAGAAAATLLAGTRGLKLVTLGALLSGVLLAAVIALPFRRPTACYAKVGPVADEGLRVSEASP